MSFRIVSCFARSGDAGRPLLASILESGGVTPSRQDFADMRIQRAWSFRRCSAVATVKVNSRGSGRGIEMRMMRRTRVALSTRCRRTSCPRMAERTRLRWFCGAGGVAARCVPAVLAAFAFWATSLCSVGARCAEPLPAGWIAGTSAGGVHDGSQTPTARNAPACSFWIVATDGCPQKATRWRPAPFCRLQWWHFDEAGGCHRADAAHFREVVSERSPVCFVVHGSFVTMESLLQDAVGATRWLRSGTGGAGRAELVFFHWPSGGITTLIPGRPLTAIAPAIDVAELGKRADRNGEYLRQLMGQIASGRDVGLIGHSYGCRVIAAALQRLALCGWNSVGSPLPGPDRIRVLFAAAAIEHDWLNPGSRFGAALDCVEGLVNLRNRHDPILRLFPLRYPFASRALGVSGFTRKDCLLNGHRSGRIVELDVSPLIGPRHVWWKYYTQPSIAQSVAAWILFADRS